ncbi:MAG: glycosyltransferase, partial [Ktedonobacteraceae bacterium]
MFYHARIFDSNILKGQRLYTANKNQVDVRITISIITATYNAAALLPTLIDSLRVQTDKDFEWIVADGGSTD